MKTKKLIFRIIGLSTVLALGVSAMFFKHSSPIKVEAAQILENFDPYTYAGNYYSNAEVDFEAEGGMNGALRQKITSISVPKGFYTYSGNGEHKLSTQLQYADEDPTNSSNMIYFYTRNSVTKTNGTVDGTIMWNREHVWCQSLSNDNWGTSEAGTDILHLRPSYESTNKSRGNTPYGNTGHKTLKTYSGMNFGWTGNGYFEPLDSVKGDVARIIMYLWTTYYGYKAYNPLNILSVFDSYDTLLSWHTLDKPDALEGNRNDYSESSDQKNRNPFVDHPELAWKIFGDEVSSSVKNACMTAYPADSGETPITPTPSGDTITASLSLADYATANSITSGTKVSSIALDSVATARAIGSDGNTGKIYINSSNVTEWRFYSSGNGSLSISVADGYDLLSASGQVATSGYGTPSLVNFTVSDNVATYTSNANFNIKSLTVTYQVSPGTTYTVTFNTNGGNNISSQSVVENGTANIPDDPEKNSDENYNYRFDSWYSDVELQNEYDFDTPVTADLTLYAKWIQTSRSAQDVIENLNTKTSLAYRYQKQESTVTDALNYTKIGATGNTYSSWSDKTDTSNAVYAGNSAGSYTSIQIRKSSSSQAKSGIVSTTSGGKIQRVAVSWNSNNTSGRILNVYGSNTPYTGPTNLYSADTFGTLLGTIVYGTSTELVVTGNYTYVGIVPSSGAAYLDSLTFDWSATASFTFPRAGIRFTAQLSVSLWNRLNSESTILGYGVLRSDADFLGDDELKDYYELADNDVVKDFYKPLTEKAHPDTTNNGQDYIWSLFKQIENGDFKTVYVAVAYIKTTSGIIFLNQAEASVKSLATNLLSNEGNNNDSYEGSLYYLSHLD